MHKYTSTGCQIKVALGCFDYTVNRKALKNGFKKGHKESLERYFQFQEMTTSIISINNFN